MLAPDQVVPDTGGAILLLAVFVLPGFITLLLRERLYVVRGEDSAFERLLQALFNSAVIYGMVIGVGLVLGLDKADLSELRHGHKSLLQDFGAAILVCLILPALLAMFGLRWTSSKRMRPRLLRAVGGSEAHNVLSGWNELFSQQGGAMIRASLADGRVVGGFYGAPSLAGYSQHTQDLFISERWELDEDSWFVRAAPGSLGLWLPRESIVSLEIYATESEVPDG